MYKITCCRLSKRINKRNVEHKGCFIKEFKTLSEFVKFFKKAKRSLFFPNISNEISNKEMRILLIKTEAALK